MHKLTICIVNRITTLESYHSCNIYFLILDTFITVEIAWRGGGEGQMLFANLTSISLEAYQHQKKNMAVKLMDKMARQCRIKCRNSVQ